MTIAFPSDAEAWLDAYQDALNDSEKYGDAGAKWGVDFDGSFVFHVRPDDVYDGDDLHMYLNLVDGECRDAYVVNGGDDVEYGFALRADYADWKRLIRGELNPIEAILSGPFTLDGDRLKVMQWSQAGLVMTRLASSIDTEFEY